MKKKSKRTLTPKLRFPEFREGAEWKAKPLGEMCDRIVEKVGDTPLTPVSITAGKGFASQVEKFGRDISGAQYKNYILLRQGDFAYNKGNSKSYPQGCVRRLKEFDQAAAPSAFVSFRLHDGYVPEFFEGLFEKNAHGHQLIKFITSSARNDGLLNISPDEFFSVNLPMPQDPDEQKKIAECLSSLDGLIAAEGRTLEALRDHKRGLMQQLFPQPGQTQPRLRFPEFRGAGEWEEKRLEDLAKRGSGHTPSKSKPEYYNGGIKWVSLADSKRLDNGLISDTEIEISNQGIENSSAVLHPAGTVVISRDAGVGKSAVMEVPMAVSQHFIVWTCNRRLLSNWFLYHLLQNMKPRFESIATGSTIKTIGLQYFKDLSVTVPSLPEQHRIADCLTTLDTRIAAQAGKIETLKQYKRGLMQQLFPAPEEQ